MAKADAMDTDAPRDIRDLLGFRLSLLTTVSDRKAQAQISAKFGMNLGEWRTLGAIKAWGPATLADLARTLYQDKGQLSRTIKSLSQRGLVSSAYGAQGRRSPLFRLTAEGRRQHDRMLRYAGDRNAHLLEALAPRERAQIFQILDKLRNAAEEAYREVSAGNAKGRGVAPQRARRQRPEARP